MFKTHATFIISILSEVDNEEEATDVTWESGYGTGEAVLQEWIGEGHQSTLSTDSDLGKYLWQWRTLLVV